MLGRLRLDSPPALPPLRAGPVQLTERLVLAHLLTPALTWDGKFVRHRRGIPEIPRELQE